MIEIPLLEPDLLTRCFAAALVTAVTVVSNHAQPGALAERRCS